MFKSLLVCSQRHIQIKLK